jgi:hypothetical protein
MSKCVNCGRDPKEHVVVAASVAGTSAPGEPVLICPNTVYKPYKSKPMRHAKA